MLLCATGSSKKGIRNSFFLPFQSEYSSLMVKVQRDGIIAITDTNMLILYP